MLLVTRFLTAATLNTSASFILRSSKKTKQRQIAKSSQWIDLHHTRATRQNWQEAWCAEASPPIRLLMSAPLSALLRRQLNRATGFIIPMHILHRAQSGSDPAHPRDSSTLFSAARYARLLFWYRRKFRVPRPGPAVVHGSRRDQAFP